MKRLRAIELKRVNQSLKALNKLREVINADCPVCKKAHSMREFDCTGPVSCIESYLCPVKSRCESFVECVKDLDNALQLASIQLWRIQTNLEEIQSCVHRWTADHDSGRNICVMCNAFETP